MLENAVYSILSPEGYASILWKDSSRAKEAAEKMKLTAKDLKELKVIDKIIKEPKYNIDVLKNSKDIDFDSKKIDESKEIKESNTNLSINESEKLKENAITQEESFIKVSEDLKKEILKTIKEYSKKSPQEIKEERYQKFRNMGEYQII